MPVRTRKKLSHFIQVQSPILNTLGHLFTCLPIMFLQILVQNIEAVDIRAKSIEKTETTTFPIPMTEMCDGLRCSEQWEVQLQLLHARTWWANHSLSASILNAHAQYI